MKKSLIIYFLVALSVRLIETGNKSSRSQKKIENKELSLPLLTQSQENHPEESYFTIAPTLSASSSTIIPSFQPDYNLLNQPQKQQSSHNFQRESLHDSLYYRAINKHAKTCIKYLQQVQKNKSDIDAARSSLNLSHVTILDLTFNTPYRSINSNEKIESRVAAISQDYPAWHPIELLWEQLKEKIIIVEKELNQLLSYGGTFAADSLRMYYEEMALLMQDILHNQENPQMIESSLRTAIQQIDARVLSRIKEGLSSYPGYFVCPSQDLKAALLNTQEEIIVWNKNNIPLTRKSLNAYVHILYTKMDYLESGLDKVEIPRDKAEEMIKTLNKATEILKKIRIFDYPHTAA